MFGRKQEEDLLNEFGDKERKEEGVKRGVVTAHLVGREIFGKVRCMQLLSSHPLTMKDFTYPLPTGG